jgi:hypothetical protein
MICKIIFREGRMVWFYAESAIRPKVDYARDYFMKMQMIARSPHIDLNRLLSRLNCFICQARPFASHLISNCNLSIIRIMLFSMPFTLSSAASAMEPKSPREILAYATMAAMCNFEYGLMTLEESHSFIHRVMERHDISNEQLDAIKNEQGFSDYATELFDKAEGGCKEYVEKMRRSLDNSSNKLSSGVVAEHERIRYRPSAVSLLKEGGWKTYGECKYDWNGWKMDSNNVRTTNVDCSNQQRKVIGVSCERLMVIEYHQSTGWSHWRRPASDDANGLNGEAGMVGMLCENTVSR